MGHMRFQSTILLGLLFVSGSMFAQDPNFHIYLCFGQSDMEGFPGIPEEERTVVEDRFQMLAAVDFENRKRDQVQGWFHGPDPRQS
jgi:hypothetical protein